MKPKKESMRRPKKPIHVSKPATRRQILRDLGIKVRVTPYKRMPRGRPTRAGM